MRELNRRDITEARAWISLACCAADAWTAPSVRWEKCGVEVPTALCFESLGHKQHILCGTRLGSPTQSFPCSKSSWATSEHRGAHLQSRGERP